VAATLASLAAATDGYQLVVGIGHSLMLSLGKTVEGMKDYPVLAAPGIDLPSTPSALWCWLRGEHRIVLHALDGLAEAEHQRMADTHHQLVTIGGRGQAGQGRGH
ncbi:hypothetical protein ACV34S_33460, partial [Pseudomonas aeruginosa]